MAKRVSAANERWLSIPGFPLYEVSDAGRVRSLITNRILKPNISRLGYHYVSLRKDGGTFPFASHSLVLISFVGPRPPKYHTRHLDGNPANNRLSNLKWGTAKENQHDRLIHGTHDRGERSANAKLTWKLVSLIRRSPKSQTAIAKELNVSQSIISDVRLNKSWKTENKDEEKESQRISTIQNI